MGKIPADVATFLVKVGSEIYEHFNERAIKNGDDANQFIFDLAQALSTLNSTFGHNLMQRFAKEDRCKAFLDDWKKLLNEFTHENLSHLCRKKNEKVH